MRGPRLRVVLLTLLVVALLALALIALPFLLGFAGQDNLTFYFAFVGIYAIAILGLNILTGYSGQISLGHGAFMAAGAFTTAILESHFGMPYWLTIPLAGLLCAALGFLIGLPALRLSGLYLALATFALAVATPSVIKKVPFAGGTRGIVLDPVTPPFGDAISSDEWVYYLTLLIGGAGFLFAWSLLRSRTGRAFRAIRDSETAATSFGVHLATYKTLAFALSALYAGVAGSLLAIATAFVGPGGFEFSLSISLLVGVVVGGLGLIEGPLFGALLVEFLPIYAQQWLEPLNRQVARAAPGITFGIVLILIMFLARNGLAGLSRQGYIWLQRRIGAGRTGPRPGPPLREETTR